MRNRFKDVDLMLFDKVIAFDNFRQKIVLIANAGTDVLEVNYNRAVLELEQLIHLLRTGKPAPNPSRFENTVQPLFTKRNTAIWWNGQDGTFMKAIFFQVVLSNRMEAELEGSLFDAYRVLRTSNPSPYMFYFQ